jgi:hypothetical protein
LSFFQIPNTPLTSIHDICDVIESQNGVFLATPEIFECQTPNLYEIENKSSIEVRV